MPQAHFAIGTGQLVEEGGVAARREQVLDARVGCDDVGHLLAGILHIAEVRHYAVLKQEPQAAVEGGAVALLVDVAPGAHWASRPPPAAPPWPLASPSLFYSP
jgi:hypothetical protein